MPLQSQPTVVTPKLVIGLFIAFVGVVLALDRSGLADITSILRYWPAVIIAVGLAVAFQSRDLSGRVNGVFIAAIGTYALLYAMRLVHVRFWTLFWPFILIMIGVGIALQALQPTGASTSLADDGTPADTDDRVSLFAIMSGVKRSSHSARFRRGDMTAFMGGGQLDLRRASVGAGEEAVIDVYGMMSGFEIFVPANWIVSTSVVPFMASVEDKRLAPLGVEAGGVPRLLIRGFIMMASIEIKS